MASRTTARHTVRIGTDLVVWVSAAQPTMGALGMVRVHYFYCHRWILGGPDNLLSGWRSHERSGRGAAGRSRSAPRRPLVASRPGQQVVPATLHNLYQSNRLRQYPPPICDSRIRIGTDLVVWVRAAQPTMGALGMVRALLLLSQMDLGWPGQLVVRVAQPREVREGRRRPLSIRPAQTSCRFATGTTSCPGHPPQPVSIK